jgi:hypothetical protein
MPQMHSEQLLDAAATATGLADFGDPSFRDGLEVLIESIAAEAEVNDIGALTAEALLTQTLTTRLQVIDWWRTHPELDEEEVTAPVFIVGVSRSGTTALSHLLSLDPDVRSPRQWETREPVPPPEAATYDTDPRFLAALADDENSAIHMLNPGFKAMHHDPADMPTECVPIMAGEFVSVQFNAMFHIPSYATFVLQRDHTTTYEYHRRFYQLLQSRHPGRWVLKSPHHALAVDTIAAVYPDARFVWTHRDPATCVASTASISCGLGSTFSDADHRLGAGALWTELVGEMIDRLTDSRARHGDRLVDVDYAELVADPIATTRRLYDELGEVLTPETEELMLAHSEVHQQHRHGRHEYTFDEFGLDRTALDERFADYRAAYEC